MAADELELAFAEEKSKLNGENSILRQPGRHLSFLMRLVDFFRSLRQRKRSSSESFSDSCLKKVFMLMATGLNVARFELSVRCCSSCCGLFIRLAPNGFVFGPSFCCA